MHRACLPLAHHRLQGKTHAGEDAGSRAQCARGRSDPSMVWGASAHSDTQRSLSGNTHMSVAHGKQLMPQHPTVTARNASLSAAAEVGQGQAERNGARGLRDGEGATGSQGEDGGWGAGTGWGRVRTHGFQDADGLLAEPHRVEHVVVEDGLEQVILIVSLERGLPSHHFIHQHPQGPPVH